MLSKIKSYGLMGIDGFSVSVEVYVSGGLPAYDTVGLPGCCCAVSLRNVCVQPPATADLNSQCSAITVNLAPGRFAQGRFSV